MKKLLNCLLVISFVVGMIVTGCAPKPTPVLTPVAQPPSVSTPIPKITAQVATKSPWQEKWDKLVSDAKKERKVVIYSSVGPSVRSALSKSFTGKYGVDLELISGKPAELVPKVQAERRAGIYSADLFIAGSGTVVPNLGPEGALVPLNNILLLPEVLDGQNWFGGDLLWINPYLQVAFFATVRPPVVINTDLVKADEIKSHWDLLNPKWKGKISFTDPTMAGGGNSFFTKVADTLGLDYLRELGKQEPVFTRDIRLQAEWLARGKYPVVIGIVPDVITEFRKAGAPIKVIALIEGDFVECIWGGLALMDKAPYPNAAALFINWLLSKEGQTVISKEAGAQSARVDVQTDFLEPEMVRQPGVKYYTLIGEDVEIRKREYMKLAKEIYGHLLK